MPKAICSKCGSPYYGWALEYIEHRFCKKCGEELFILII